ncbi:MAG: HNH endonuclease [Fimbriimonadales bacterium]
MAEREKIPIDVRQHVLHLAGYICANPACRQIVTLDMHHMIEVVKGGGPTKENLIALCPNCHALYHRGGSTGITHESIRAWHYLLLAINEAYPRHEVDILLALRKLGQIRVSGDGVLRVASAVASGMIRVIPDIDPNFGNFVYDLCLDDKGLAFVDGWIAGDQTKAVGEVVTAEGGGRASVIDEHVQALRDAVPTVA